MKLKAPDFFWQSEPNYLARALAPIGKIIGHATLRRMARAGERAALPVVCIGNPVAGGAGKTPTALAMGQLLINMGRCPVFLTRGYGGDHPGPLLVDKSRHSAHEVGDEPLLLAAIAPTVVAHDRVAGAQLAASLGGDVILMDDGFQNSTLIKDISLLVIDAHSGIGNGQCLPAGPLRAPFAAQLEHADGIVLIGDGEAGSHLADHARAAGKAVHIAHIVPEPLAAGRLERQRVLAYAGIGHPQKFARTLKALGADVVLKPFADHHRFSVQDAQDLLNEAHRDGRMLVTTEKDAARLASDPALDALREASTVLPVRLTFTDNRAMAQMLAGV